MNQIIEGKLATQGIQQFPSFSYLTEGNNRPQTNQQNEDSWPVVDVRDLYDALDITTHKNNNTLQDYEKKIDQAYDMIQRYGRVVICCVAGTSRSPAIAIGVLLKYYNMTLEEATNFVYQKVRISDINQMHIESLKELLFNTNKRHPSLSIFAQ
jgi:protein-tyrosine phosphatase